MAFRAASAAVVTRGLRGTDGVVRAASAALWFARSASSLQPAPPTLLGMGEEALTRLARDMGQPAYRGKQIHDAIYGMRKASVDDMKQLPESFREQLVSAGLEVGRRAPVEVVSSPDGTRKVLIELHCGSIIEAVGIPQESPEARDAASEVEGVPLYEDGDELESDETTTSSDDDESRLEDVEGDDGWVRLGSELARGSREVGKRRSVQTRDEEGSDTERSRRPRLRDARGSPCACRRRSVARCGVCLRHGEAGLQAEPRRRRDREPGAGAGGRLRAPVHERGHDGHGRATDESQAGAPRAQDAQRGPRDRREALPRSARWASPTRCPGSPRTRCRRRWRCRCTRRTRRWGEARAVRLRVPDRGAARGLPAVQGRHGEARDVRVRCWRGEQRTPAQAEALAKTLGRGSAGGATCGCPGTPSRAPITSGRATRRCVAFSDALGAERGITHTVRRTRGLEADAACGQLTGNFRRATSARRAA